MTTYEVTCVTRDDSDTITGIGSDTKRWTKAEAIREIKSRKSHFYTMVNGQKADVLVRGTAPNEYLTTDPDETEENNLEKLLDCS